MADKKVVKRNTKSTSNKPSPNIDNTLLNIIELVESLYCTPELEKIKASVKHGQSGIEVPARKEIYNVVRFLLEEGGFNKAFVDLENTVKNTNDRVGQLLAVMSNGSLEKFLVPGTLKTRYEEDYPAPKKRVAEFVVKKFFNVNELEDKRVSCFVQASTTSIHLACELSREKIPSGSLFYTNSIVFPLIVLQDHSNVSVYTHCGTGYDPLCGGWFPQHEDDEAKNHLKALFNRENNPLRDAILTPIAITIDKSELFFTKSELVDMVDIMVDCSSRLILMSFRSRIFASSGDAMANDLYKYCPLHSVKQKEWPVNGNKPQLIIAYDEEDSRTEEEWKDVVIQLCKRGFEIYWQDSEKKWHWSSLAKKT